MGNEIIIDTKPIKCPLCGAYHLPLAKCEQEECVEYQCDPFKPKG